METKRFNWKVGKFAIYGAGLVLLAQGLSKKFASECVNDLRARGQVVTMTEED